MRSALVLGGGGLTGIAFELGVIHGLAEAGIDLTTADMVIGTSAGSVVGYLARTGAVARGFAAQHEDHTDEIAARLSWASMARMAAAYVRPGGLEQKLARVGRMAMAAPPVVSAERRLEVIRTRVGEGSWPDRDLRLTAVDVETGRLRAFDRDAGVDVEHAVAASCAVPFVWPPVEIDGRHYIDGGVRSATNADLAAGADIVVVIAPIPRSVSRATSIRAQLATTGATRTVVVTPDRAAVDAMGRYPLDPSHRAVSADAGLRQASAVAADLRDWPA